MNTAIVVPALGESVTEATVGKARDWGLRYAAPLGPVHCLWLWMLDQTTPPPVVTRDGADWVLSWTDGSTVRIDPVASDPAQRLRFATAPSRSVHLALNPIPMEPMEVWLDDPPSQQPLTVDGAWFTGLPIRQAAVFQFQVPPRNVN